MYILSNKALDVFLGLFNTCYFFFSFFLSLEGMEWYSLQLSGDMRWMKWKIMQITIVYFC